MSFDTPVPPATADPSGPQLSSSCFEFLLIELVPLAYRLTDTMTSRDLAATGFPTTTISTHPKSGPVSAPSAAATGTVGGGLGIGGIGGAVEGLDEEETREAVFWRLDGLGYRVGLGIVDKWARDKPRFTDTLDVIKFLCKDLWTLVFRKQIDNLKTNHRVRVWAGLEDYDMLIDIGTGCLRAHGQFVSAAE
jgi:trafficking protein particle complex subunit 6